MPSRNHEILPDFDLGTTYMFDFSNNQNTITGTFGLRIEDAVVNSNKIDYLQMEFSIIDKGKCISLFHVDKDFKIESKLFEDIFPYKNAFICDTFRTFVATVESKNDPKCTSNITFSHFKFILNETKVLNGK